MRRNYIVKKFRDGFYGYMDKRGGFDYRMRDVKKMYYVEALYYIMKELYHSYKDRHAPLHTNCKYRIMEHEVGEMEVIMRS